MKSLTKLMRTGTFSAVLAMGMSWADFGGDAKAEETVPVIKDHRIGYLVSGMHWSVYQTGDGKTECPQGLNNNGPRENFKALYPNGGKQIDTEFAREGLKAAPQDKPSQFPYIEVQGNTGIGLNLDGKIGPRDFTSPDGEKGIDNALYRVTGCTPAFRGPIGDFVGLGERFILVIPSHAFHRMMIEISNVDNLENDDNVDVTLYRGRDWWVLDSTSVKVVPGGSQRIDMHYGKKLIRHMHGKIENGVLTTDPIPDTIWPWQFIPHVPRVLRIHDMRLRLKLSPTNAEGQLGGYFDVASVYNWVAGYSTGNASAAHIDAPEFYWAMRRNADAYPDENGNMTAISSALSLKLTQVFIMHPDAPAGKQVLRSQAHRAPGGSHGRIGIQGPSGYTYADERTLKRLRITSLATTLIIGNHGF